MDPTALGLDASLIEAAKKCNCKENDAYNPSAAGPARLPSEVGDSVPDAMTGKSGKINIADDKKHGKGCTCNECMDAMMPGYDKSIK